MNVRGRLEKLAAAMASGAGCGQCRDLPTWRAVLPREPDPGPSRCPACGREVTVNVVRVVYVDPPAAAAPIAG